MNDDGTRRLCLRPWKRRYPTERAASDAAGRRAFALGKPFYTYRCRCGWWHVTTQPQVKRPGGSGSEAR